MIKSKLYIHIYLNKNYFNNTANTANTAFVLYSFFAFIFLSFIMKYFNFFFLSRSYSIHSQFF